MAQDRPTAGELIEAIREFIDRDVMPELTGRKAFHVRVTLNVLATLQRELELAPDFDRAERDRLRQLLARDGSLAELNRALAEEIRAGRLDDRYKEVLDHLRQTVRDKLAIANPRHMAEDG